jgi:hypothetical protein
MYRSPSIPLPATKVSSEKGFIGRKARGVMWRCRTTPVHETSFSVAAASVIALASSFALPSRTDTANPVQNAMRRTLRVFRREVQCDGLRAYRTFCSCLNWQSRKRSDFTGACSVLKQMLPRTKDGF